MAVLNLGSNALYGENGTGKLYVATNFAGVTYNDGDGTNEAATLTAVSTLTYADLGYYTDFSIDYTNGDQRIITSDYLNSGEIMSKAEKVFGFTVTLMEPLEMTNFGRLFNCSVNSSVSGKEIIVQKRVMKNQNYLAFKFVSAPDEAGDIKTFYFVKVRLSSDFEIPATNLQLNDFVGSPISFELAEGGNLVMEKEV